MSCSVMGLGRGLKGDLCLSVCSCVCVCMCVCGLGGRREEEDKGDPICLFCPPDVSASRLRDLA